MVDREVVAVRAGRFREMFSISLVVAGDALFMEPGMVLHTPENSGEYFVRDAAPQEEGEVRGQSQIVLRAQ